METLRLWLALIPKQFEDLNNGKEVQPDEYSKRFGLRKNPLAAVARQRIMSWLKWSWRPSVTCKRPRQVSFWSTSPMSTAGWDQLEPRSLTPQGTCCTSSARKLRRSSERWEVIWMYYRFFDRTRRVCNTRLHRECSASAMRAAKDFPSVVNLKVEWKLEFEKHWCFWLEFQL